MGNFYTEEQLSTIDAVVSAINERGFYNCSNLSQQQRQALEILDEAGWVKAWRAESSNFIHVSKSKYFEAKLAGGTFSDRYRRSSNQQNNSMQQISTGNITAHNSVISFGHNNNLSINYEVYKEAIKQVEESSSLTTEEKTVIIDIIEDIKSNKELNIPFGRTLLSSIAKWSFRAIELGGAVATIFQSLPS